MRKRVALAAVLIGTTLGGCAERVVDHEMEASALMELSREWSAIISSGDMQAGMRFWADDAVMLPPDLPVLDGKEAIRAYVSSAAEIPGFRISWEPQRAFISTSGDMAYMLESNVIEVDGADGADGQKIVTHGKVVTIWRKDAQGRWMNVVDMWNAMPAPR